MLSLSSANSLEECVDLWTRGVVELATSGVRDLNAIIMSARHT